MSILFIAGIVYGTWLLANGTLYLIKRIRSLPYEREWEARKLAAIQFEEKKLFYEYKEEVKVSIDKLLEEKSKGFPWLATAIADYWENYDLIFAEYLRTKKPPAFQQANRLKEIAKEKRQFKKEFLTTKYIISYYESLFPWIREYIGIDSEALIDSINISAPDEGSDPVSFYVPEYENLSVSERNQRALERYWKSSRDLWVVGRDYERYIGYLYEIRGYKVEYHGINKLKDDLGIDLICTKGLEVELVQCKYWSSIKGIPIRENQISQLFGTSVKYYIDHHGKVSNPQLALFYELLKSSNITPVLITSTDLSETASDFASALGVKVINIPMDISYPCIKCNINTQTGEKIYHLPFDQQYDKTRIDTSKGQMWASTILEAEKNGYRRAWRWNKREGD